MPDDSLITKELLRALALKESGGRQDVVGDTDLSNPAFGMYQIRRPAYLDVVQRRKEYAGIPFEQVQQDQELNETFARAYLSVLANEYGLDTLDEILQGYNAGPGAVRRGKVPASAQAYSRDVQRLMREGQ